MKMLKRKDTQLDMFRRGLDFPFAVETFFERPFSFLPSAFVNLNPKATSVDISEDKTKITVKADLPGMESKDVKVEAKAGILTISGERKKEEDEKGRDYYRLERFQGSFCRSLPLPESADTGKLKKSFEKGVLSVTIPKKHPEKERSK